MLKRVTGRRFNLLFRNLQFGTKLLYFEEYLFFRQGAMSKLKGKQNRFVKAKLGRHANRLVLAVVFEAGLRLEKPIEKRDRKTVVLLDTLFAFRRFGQSLANRHCQAVDTENFAIVLQLGQVGAKNIVKIRAPGTLVRFEANIVFSIDAKAIGEYLQKMLAKVFSGGKRPMITIGQLAIKNAVFDIPSQTGQNIDQQVFDKFEPVFERRNLSPHVVLNLPNAFPGNFERLTHFVECLVGCPLHEYLVSAVFRDMKSHPAIFSLQTVRNILYKRNGKRVRRGKVGFVSFMLIIDEEFFKHSPCNRNGILRAIRDFFEETSRRQEQFTQAGNTSLFEHVQQSFRKHKTFQRIVGTERSVEVFREETFVEMIGEKGEISKRLFIDVFFPLLIQLQMNRTNSFDDGRGKRSRSFGNSDIDTNLRRLQIARHDTLFEHFLFSDKRLNHRSIFFVQGQKAIIGENKFLNGGHAKRGQKFLFRFVKFGKHEQGAFLIVPFFHEQRTILLKHSFLFFEKALKRFAPDLFPIFELTYLVLKEVADSLNIGLTQRIELPGCPIERRNIFA